MKFIQYCTKTIEYSFYALILLVPLIFSGDTSELFELNKMWLAFGLTAIIAAAWGTKMVLERKVSVQRTPLDIPILLFFISQVISTLISLDPQVSWWGYYSRFNGGLLSTICYIFLYYAFVSNLTLKHTIKALKVTLISGLITALWGFPAHFGADPTCLLFRGELNTKCWTEAFQPTIRTFSTLGQPAWFAAYLALLAPLAIAFALNASKKKLWMYFALAVFFYINLIFTDTRAGFLAFWAANGLLWAGIFFKKLLPKKALLRTFAVFNITFLVCSFFLGSPIGSLTKFTFPELSKKTAEVEKPLQTFSGSPVPAAVSPQINITDSGNIRLYVWNGAIEAWKSSPLFGTGVETFAFAYYKHKSPGHNLTSEWDYLYNKAHNEYLNYLTTTGLLGLGSYLAFIALFLFISGKSLIFSKKQSQEVAHSDLPEADRDILVLGLAAGFVSILITNFFGFSVVIMNLYLFLIPAFVLLLQNKLDPDKQYSFSFASEKPRDVSPFQWTLITVLVVLASWSIIGLILYRQADISYALGNNLDKTGNYQDAYPNLQKAVEAQPSEAVYKDELAINLAALGAGLYSQKDSIKGAQAAEKAIQLSDQVVEEHPNNVVYWKNRVRLFYTLSATDTEHQGQYLQQAVRAIDEAKKLAPTDAKIAYNQGILYGQLGDLEKATNILEETVKLKPDYLDAYIALGVFYHQQAIDKNGKVVNPDKQTKAIETYEYILTNLSSDNKDVQDSLKTWKNE